MSAPAGDLASLDSALGDTAPLPRDNGELVFEEPWQGRALGMAVVALERLGVPWDEFRRHLASAIAARPTVPGESAASVYYAAWLDALEELLSAHGVLDAAAARDPHAGSGSAAPGATSPSS